jgi:flavin reductase (DIM6/NTAB) family NADH-FMN oxidoreductase RutF
MNYRVFNTDEIDHMQAYRLIVGSVVPRPIAWVSTMSASGAANLAPFSFFTCVSHAPPLFSISAGERDRKMKDTVQNIMDTKGYVIHTVVNGWEEQMNESSANFAPDESEFEALGLETEPSDLVDAPRLSGAPIAMECRLEDIIVYGEEWKTHLVIGRVIRWHVREDLMIKDKYIDPIKLQPVGRLGGTNYCRTHEIFQMERTYRPPDEVHPNAPLNKGAK